MRLNMVVELLPAEDALADLILVVVRRHGVLGYRVAVAVFDGLRRFDIRVLCVLDFLADFPSGGRGGGLRGAGVVVCAGGEGGGRGGEPGGVSGWIEVGGRALWARERRRECCLPG